MLTSLSLALLGLLQSPFPPAPKLWGAGKPSPILQVRAKLSDTGFGAPTYVVRETSPYVDSDFA